MPKGVTKGKGPATKSERTTAAAPTSPRNMSGELWKHVGELAASSAFLLYLAGLASERLSLSQVAFFFAAATADAAGKPTTRTVLLDETLGGARGSIRNSYRQFLAPSRVFPLALGWLTTEENPMDAREQLLRLTPEGKQVIAGALATIQPLTESGTVQ